MTILHTSTKNVRRLGYSVIALALLNINTLPVFAQGDHNHDASEQQMTADQLAKAGALVKVVRQATARFKDVAVAESEGYHLVFGCVSGDASGAMGLHYLNGAILNSGVIDATHPQIVIYEPQPGGGLKLIGADYLVFVDAWNKTHDGPPQLMGQLFHLFNAPNRFNLPAFYTLHVWAWMDNPRGAFVNWHPNVSCEPFNDQK
jgi:hypothetical protein